MLKLKYPIVAIFLLGLISCTSKIDVPDKPDEEDQTTVSIKFRNFSYTVKAETADFYIGDKLYENIPIKDSSIILDKSISGTINDIIFYSIINSKKVAIDWYSSESGIKLPITNSDSLIYISDFAGGKGTIDNPYSIANPRQLDRLRLFSFTDSSCYVKLTKDIDLKDACSIDGAPFYNSGKGWAAINYFKGRFDGNRHTIKGLTIKDFYPYTGNRDKGLFGFILETDIFDLKLIDVNIDLISSLHSAFYYSGALIGATAKETKIDNVHLSNIKIKVTPLSNYNYNTYGSRCGSLVGFGSEGLKISNCSVKDSEISCPGNTESVIGGLIGVGNLIDIQNCFVECNLEGDICGGIAGFTNPYSIKNISNCYVTGTMKNEADFKAGGIVGIDSYSWNLYIYSSCSAYKYITSDHSNLTLARIADYDLSMVNFPLICSNYSLENTIEGTYYTILEPENLHFNGNNLTISQSSSADFFISAPLLWDFSNIWKMSNDGTHPELIGF